MPYDEAKVLDDVKCPKCKQLGVIETPWDSDDGAYTDYHYECKTCHHMWWVDGPDA